MRAIQANVFTAVPADTSVTSTAIPCAFLTRLSAIATIAGITASNEIQLLTIDATGGNFTLSFDGQGPTSAITYDPNDPDQLATDVTAALEALSNIGSGDVDVSVNEAGTIITVEFVGALAAANQAQMTASGAGLTGGAGTITPSTSQVGGTAVDTSLKLQVTNADPTDPNPSWLDYPSAAVSFTADATKSFSMVDTLIFSQYRLVYTRTAGSGGTLTVKTCAQGF